MVSNIVLEHAHSGTRSDLMRGPGKIRLNIPRFINGSFLILGNRKFANIVGKLATDFIGLIKITNIGASVRIGLGFVPNAIIGWTIDRWEKFTGQKAVKLA